MAKGKRDPVAARAADAALGPEAASALQRLVGNTAVSELLGRARAADTAAADHRTASVHEALRSPGRPLDDSVRTDMEATLGADFSDVRVHTDQTAHESAESVAAQAYTTGSHIVFQRGRYDPGSNSGRHVLAHELTHVVQQRRGPVAGTETGGGLAISDPSDRFEREAERVAAGAMAGTPASPTATPDAGPGLPVARLMSVAEFRRRTAGQQESLLQIDEALAAYHRVEREDYGARRAKLERLKTVVEDYLGAEGARHTDEVRELANERHTEHLALEMRETVLRIQQQVVSHGPIWHQLYEADREPDKVEQVRGILTAQEAILRQIEATGADDYSDLRLANLNLGGWLNTLIYGLGGGGGDDKGLPEEDRQRLVEDDLRMLTEIQADANAPRITRDILGDLLARRDIVKLGVGSPGTKLSPAGTAEKYTTTVPKYQLDGATERAGALAHELTHVDAGEAYANTLILLLFMRGLGEDRIRDLARSRKAEIDRLETLLTQTTALTGRQKDLCRAKLKYAVHPKKGVGEYARSHRSKLDESTYEWLLHIDKLTAPNSQVLVEYDTVINQLLVYLHRWGVDQAEPLYAAVMRVAAAQRIERSVAGSNP